MGIELWLAGFALLIAVASACVAVRCALTPPQQRAVAEVRALAEETAADLADLHSRMITRARKTNMDGARERHEEKKQRQQRIEEEALALVQANRQQPQPPTDPEALRVALVKKHLN